MSSVAPPERHQTPPPSAHLVTCAYCKSIVSAVLARLGSVGCHTCRSIHGV
jgi:hypothetical protein